MSELDKINRFLHRMQDVLHKHDLVPGVKPLMKDPEWNELILASIDAELFRKEKKIKELSKEVRNLQKETYFKVQKYLN